VSHVHVQQLEAVRHEFEAAREGITQVLADPSLPHHGHLRQAAANLESTYVARLFSEFEGILRHYLWVNDPGRRLPRDVYTCINRVGALARVPDSLRLAVHQVREYRNAIVHQNGLHRSPLTFRQVISALNRFLAPLP